MLGPVPAQAKLRTLYPRTIVAGNYMRLSGTSFASPVVAGIAAQLPARHPSWTPDQVKGALMQTASSVAPGTDLMAAGAGEVNAAAANAVAAPINPNAALNQFVARDSAGKASFDAEPWVKAVIADPEGWDVSVEGAAWGSAWEAPGGSTALGSAWGSIYWLSDPLLVTLEGSAWAAPGARPGVAPGALRGAAPGASAWGSSTGTAWGTVWSASQDGIGEETLELPPEAYEEAPATAEPSPEPSQPHGRSRS